MKRRRGGATGGNSRFSLWRDYVHSTAQIGAVEFGAPSVSPFKATIEATPLGPVTYAKMVGTINRVTRTAQSLRSATCDSYQLVINLGTGSLEGTYGERDLKMAPGGAFLDGMEPQDIRGNDHNGWVSLSFPKKVLDERFTRIGNRQGLAIAPDQEPLILLRRYLQFLDSDTIPASDLLTGHIAETIIDLVGLATGAKGDEADLAGLGGICAARLQTILDSIRDNYSNPTFCVQTVAGQLSMTPRYVNALLAETGAGFTERVLELRLLQAKAMLCEPRFFEMRISDIALRAGLSDISYFNRCFRRRFGCSPGGAR
ncbi:AraC family transcriptional regulator (plasmid) [Rhizobium sp. RCAM05350]|nr:AraC family transcriptional regulator [Rhizobium sp. RCAM05350]